MNEDLMRDLEELARKWDGLPTWLDVNFSRELRAVLAKHKQHAAA